MPDYTPRLNLPKPLGTESVKREAHNALVDAIDAGAAKRSDVGDMSTVPTTSKVVAGAITELFQSVSSGKSLVAAAITGKGVPTAASDTFQKMATNIGGIVLGSGDAQPGDVRAGKTFSNDSGPGKIGTKPVQVGGNVIPTGSDIVKAAGIYDTAITVKGVVVPAAKVLNDTTIAGTPGSMPNRTGHVTGQSISRSGTTLRVRPQPGYVPGDAANSVQWSDPNWIAANIRKDVPLFGLTGSLVEGRPEASGATPATVATDMPIIVSGLSFTPKIIVVVYDNQATQGIYLDASTGVGPTNVNLRVGYNNTIAFTVNSGGFSFKTFESLSGNWEWIAFG